MKVNSVLSTTRLAVVAATALVAAGCTQGAPSTSSQLSDASNPGTPSDVTIAQTLQNRPEFSDFRDIVKLAGLWESLNTSQGLTVLAPDERGLRAQRPRLARQYAIAVFGPGEQCQYHQTASAHPNVRNRRHPIRLRISSANFRTCGRSAAR